MKDAAAGTIAHATFDTSHTYEARALDRELDAVLADPLHRGRLTDVDPIPAIDQASQLRLLLAQNESALAQQDGPSAESAARPADFEPFANAADPFRPSPEPDLATQRRAKVIAVTSGKGGVGKTSVAVNLAACLAQRGLRSVLVDADLGTANADILCGVTPHARLDHVVTELPVHDGARRTLADIAIPAPGGFRLVPGSAGIARLADLSEPQQRRLLADFAELERDSDVILVDTGAGVGLNVIRFVASAEVALVVLTPEPTSLTDAYSLIKCLHRHLSDRFGGWTGLEDFGPRVAVVVNQVADPAEARQTYSRLCAVADRFLAVRLFYGGSVAQDVRVPQSIRARRPFVVGSPAAEASQDLRSLSAFLVRELGLEPSRAQAARSAQPARPSLLRRWFGA